MEGETLEDDSNQAIGSLQSIDDASELKGKFDEQQQMIGQLEAISKAHEKGMEDYTLRLAKMKPRLRGRGRGRTRTTAVPRIPIPTDISSISTTKIEESSESNWPVETIDLPKSEISQVAIEELGDDSSASASVIMVPASPIVPKLDGSRSKALLLRKQLEENRVKFDKQQKENVDKRIAMEEMRDRVEVLRVEVENRDQLIQSLQQGDTSGAEPDSRILYQQIIHKDNTILDLTEKVNQLEMYIQDQREQIEEKEQVIVARTEAVGLVAKDSNQKLITTVDQLEQATVSAHKLQKLYDTDSSHWRDKEKSLNKIIAEKDAKICTFEENSKRTEAVRFQLSARNAEVQDKLVAVQTEMQVINSKLKLAEKKLIESSDEITELNKKVNRSEAFGQKKLKTFEKYFKSVEEEDLGERILMLTNNIAILEEEKGNLQLKLVDCDEINSINERLSSDNIHLEAKCDNLQLELLSFSATVKFLEKEKITLIDSLNEINLQKNNFTEQLSARDIEIENMKHKLDALDLSFSSLEKERDLVVDKLKNYEANDKSSEISNDKITRENDNLRQLLQDRDTELSILRTDNDKLRIEHDKQTEIATVAVQNEIQKREEGESLLELLTNKEEFIRSQTNELGNLQDAVNGLEEKLTLTHQKDRDYETKMQALHQHVSQSEHTLVQLRNEVSNLRKTYSDSEKRNAYLQQNVNELNKENEKKTEFVNRLQSEIGIMAERLESAKNTIESSGQELEQRSNKLGEVMEELRELHTKHKEVCNECDAIRDEFISYEDTTKKAAADLKSELNVVSALISDKDSQNASLRSDIKIKEDQIKNSDIMIAKFEQDNCDNNRKIDDLLNSTSSLETELNMMSAMIADKDNTISTLNSDIEIKHKEIENNQIMISKFETENCSHNVEIDKLTEQNLVYEREIKEMNDRKNEYESIIQCHVKEIKDLNNLILEKDTSIMSLRVDIESSSTLSAKLSADLEESRQSLLSLQEINEELNTTMESIKVKNHDTFSQLESTKLNYENEIVLLRQDIGDKQSQITYMENEIELSKEQQVAVQQALICTSSEQLTTLQQSTYELGVKLSELSNQLDEKQRENTSLKASLEDRNMEYAATNAKLIESNEHIHFLTNNLADNVKNCENIIMAKESIEYQRDDLKRQVEDLKFKLINNADYSAKKLSEELFSATVDTSNTVTEGIPPQETEHTKDDANQLSLVQEQCEKLLQEKVKLERDLLEAQQAIVRLETSLATQSTQEDGGKDSWNEWGDVDLGQKNQLEPSLQTTLTEKDRVLNMTQDQLKDALEQVNTVVDEKKLIEQQMKVLEAELHHKQEKIDVYVEEIKRLEMAVQHLEDRFSTMHQQSTVHDKQPQTIANPDCDEILSKQPEMESEHIQSSPVDEILVAKEASNFQENVTITTNSEAVKADAEEDSQNVLGLEDQYKLKWYEEMWPQWTETYNQMCSEYQAAQNQVSLLQSQLNDSHAQLAEASNVAKADIQSSDDNLKETQDYARNQEELTILQNQIGMLEIQVIELKSECDRLRPFEALCSERRAVVQELEAKRDGTIARISELELMVQSAESEICRLRSAMQSLTTAGNSLETERSCLKEEITNLNEEIRKNNAERERLGVENATLQHQAAAQLSSTTQLEETNQRMCSENAQLRSELEVIEGDAERTRTSWEFLEGECSRLRAENEIIVQNGQVLEAEKESLAHELQRISNQLGDLVSERDHLKGEGQRLLELSTSAESEIARLKIHLENMNDLTSRYQLLENQYTDLQSKLSDIENASSIKRSLTVEEIDWSAEGSLEKEHFQSSDNSEEIELLKEQIRQLEKNKISLSDELYAAKLKNGKMIQKLKISSTKVENLQKELEKCKQSGISELDAAIEAAWKEQIETAESERDEYKIKADEFEKEKYSFVKQIDVLQSAQEKYLELKENQDSDLYRFSERNKTLETQVSSMEWKIAELEEALEEKSIEGPQSGGDSAFYINRIAILEKDIERYASEKSQTNKEMEHMKSMTEEAESDCNKMRIMLSEMREMKERLENDCGQYKKTYHELHSEHESLIDIEKKSSNRITALLQELNTLKYSYDSIYNEYNNLQLDRDTVKYEFGILAGEKEKLQEELTSLNNIQAALKEEEQETVIISLQEECATQRQQNNDLKDEITQLGESVRQAEEEAERAKHTLEQQLEIQELVRDELNEKMMEVNYLNTSHESQEKDIKYERAEVAALKAKVSHLQQNLEQYQSPAQSDTEVDGSQLHLSQSPISSGTSLEFTAHLADLRCRQMSVEINKLLEERDALQLKLSSSLRQIQELSRELSLSQQLPTPPPPNALKKKLAELRELNSNLEERTETSPLSFLPPTMPTFVSHTAPPTPTASRQKDLQIIRDTQQSFGIVGWILGKGPEKEVLHV